MSARVSVSKASIARLTAAALDTRRVSGWTHDFYRYPARFSPRFAAAAIEEFSRPGQLVLDPFMGGGTTVVEALAAGRNAAGNDLNSLAVFVATAKTVTLSEADERELRAWIRFAVPSFGYRARPSSEDAADSPKTKNLGLARGRFIKKATAVALESLSTLRAPSARTIARCSLLRVGQWALDGRSQHTSLVEYRGKLARVTEEMIVASASFTHHRRGNDVRASLFNHDARTLDSVATLQSAKADLVVTSPPYPGVHVLYHRWQVDGRRETAAPYWISNCNDGKGVSFYNFGGRKDPEATSYFSTSLATLRAVRNVMRDGAYIVQMIAFNRPDDQLPRYLANMNAAGFEEVAHFSEPRIWRRVPNRRWHANLRGETHGASEVVLVHRAAQ